MQMWRSYDRYCTIINGDGELNQMKLGKARVAIGCPPALT